MQPSRTAGKNRGGSTAMNPPKHPEGRAHAALRLVCVLRDCVVLVADFLRVRAALFAWRESALCEAAERGSRFNAAALLRERRADTAFFLRLWPRLLSRAADLRVFSETLPFFGGARSTPARRALDSPMAMACLA